MSVTQTEPLSLEQIATLRSQLSGGVLLPADDEYDAARAVWNGMIDRRPAAIARCATTADVVAAVKFAVAQGLGVAIRGGGHNAAGLAVADGALVVDLTTMNQVDVDPDKRIARAGGGTTWGPFDAATQAHGLATTGGAISMTGIAGLTLGGGLGYLMRSYGLTCDNLIAAEVVTADGRVVNVSETENAELLWGLRGGGGNFGVVTRFDFRLYPVAMVLGGMFLYPADRAAEVLRAYRDITAQSPEELTAFAALLAGPDATPVAAVVVCYNGQIKEGERAVKPFRDLGPIVDQVGPMPYTALQSMLDPGFPVGLPVYWRSHFLTDLADEGLDKLVDAFTRLPTPLSSILIEQLGGAVQRVGRNDTAFDHRDADYNLAIIARWPDPALAETGIAWSRGLWSAMTPHARGVYVNYLGVGEATDRIRAAYGDEKYARLVALKNQYDPGNIFRFNQNIVPS